MGLYLLSYYQWDTRSFRAQNHWCRNGDGMGWIDNFPWIAPDKYFKQTEQKGAADNLTRWRLTLRTNKRESQSLLSGTWVISWPFLLSSLSSPVRWCYRDRKKKKKKRMLWSSSWLQFWQTLTRHRCLHLKEISRKNLSLEHLNPLLREDSQALIQVTFSSTEWET